MGRPTRPRASTRSSTCIQCETRPCRPLWSISRELHDPCVVVAIEWEVLIERPTERWEERSGRALARIESFMLGLACELEGWCVYCAHTMEESRRQALKAHEANLGKGVARG